MIKILHSGEFLDYEGNTIRVTFYEEKHLWMNMSDIHAPAQGGVYLIHLWSDVGGAFLYSSDYEWVSNPAYVESYTNKDGYIVNVYRVVISNMPSGTIERSAKLYADVEFYNPDEMDGYEDSMIKTITITQQ